MIALLLPAVQAAREAARRMECLNKVKQLSLALHNYHDINLSFPAGRVCRTTAATGALSEATDIWCTWFISVLPFVEQGPLYNEYSFTLANCISDDRAAPAAGSVEAINCKVVGTSISAFNCPSDEVAGEGLRPWKSPNVNRAVASYRAISGRAPDTGDGLFSTTSGFDPAKNVPMGWRGVLHLSGDRVLCGAAIQTLPWESMASIVDGTSNTVVMAEFHRDKKSTENNHGIFWGYGRASDFISSVTIAYSSKYLFQKFSDCSKATTADFPTGGIAVGSYCKNISFYSYHPGGFNIGICDGSSKFLSTTVDTNIWAGAATIDGGESTSIP